MPISRRPSKHFWMKIQKLAEVIADAKLQINSGGELEVESGGELNVESGGALDIESGGELQLAGTAITATAAELNTLDGITATLAELNTLDISAVGGAVKVLEVPFTTPADGSENDSGVEIPVKSVVLGVWVDVTTLEATGTTKTLDVGLLSGEGGDPDGFLDGISVAAAGVIKGTLASGGQTLGALLRVDEDGAGALAPEPHVCDGTAVTISYTAGSADFAELVGSIYVMYMEIG